MYLGEMQLPGSNSESYGGPAYMLDTYTPSNVPEIVYMDAPAPFGLPPTVMGMNTNKVLAAAFIAVVVYAFIQSRK